MTAQAPSPPTLVRTTIQEYEICNLTRTNAHPLQRVKTFLDSYIFYSLILDPKAHFIPSLSSGAIGPARIVRLLFPTSERQ